MLNHKFLLSWLLIISFCSCLSSCSSGGTPTNNPTITETIPSSLNLSMTSPAASTATSLAELINSAASKIDIEAFYFNNQANTVFNELVMQSLFNKAVQGIKIRIIVDQTYANYSLSALSAIESFSNVSIRVNNYFDSINGILHAKMITVDDQKFYIGSSNFDWISFVFNHEVGGIATNPILTAQLESVFNEDYESDVGYNPQSLSPAMPSGNVFIATSPNFSGVPSEEDNILNLINNAKYSINLQTFQIQNYNPYTTPASYWYALESALVAAANRGVTVNLMMSNMEFAESSEAGQLFTSDNQFLKSIVTTPHLTIRYSTFPTTISPWGCESGSAYDHSKYMIVDQTNVWIGTGNLEQSYFTNTRDYSIFVINNPLFASDINTIFWQMWDSQYMTTFSQILANPVNLNCSVNY